MGVTIADSIETEGKLFVFVLNGVGEKHTVALEKENNGLYDFRYEFSPAEDWSGEVFQEVIEVRDEAFEYIREELGFSIASHCLSPTEQIILSPYWDEIEEVSNERLT